MRDFADCNGVRLLLFNPQTYNGQITQIRLNDSTHAVGGEQAFAFHFFESKRSYRPLLALEVGDIYPYEWPPVCCQAYGSALESPLSWAKAAVDKGAQAIVLELKSIDPNGQNAGPESVCELVEKLLPDLQVPLIVWGCDNVEKDALVLAALAEKFSGRQLVLGPVEEANYQLLANMALKHGHIICASSPIDVNLAKQLNILLRNQGLPLDRIIIDPTTGGLGYGLEYTYSVMERLRIAALQQNDQTLALPIICNLGKEIWKSKEARLLQSDVPEMGEDSRGIMMEVSAGVSLLLAGADILVLSHPQSLKLLREFIDNMYAPSRLEQAGA